MEVLPRNIQPSVLYRPKSLPLVRFTVPTVLLLFSAKLMLFLRIIQLLGQFGK